MAGFILVDDSGYMCAAQMKRLSSCNLYGLMPEGTRDGMPDDTEAPPIIRGLNHASHGYGLRWAPFPSIIIFAGPYQIRTIEKGSRLSYYHFPKLGALSNVPKVYFCMLRNGSVLAL